MEKTSEKSVIWKPRSLGVSGFTEETIEQVESSQLSESERIHENISGGNQQEEKTEFEASADNNQEEFPGLQPLELIANQEVIDRATAQARVLTHQHIVIDQINIKGIMSRFVIRQGNFIWAGLKNGWIFEPDNVQVLQMVKRFRKKSEAVKEAKWLQEQLKNTDEMEKLTQDRLEQLKELIK